MSAVAIFLSFLQLLLYIAIIIFIAWTILWLLNWAGIAISAEMLKWGRVIVGLLCIIAVVGWLVSVFAGGNFPIFHPFWR
jgi:hypothetical protein